jgi:hypothetical protein
MCHRFIIINPRFKTSSHTYDCAVSTYRKRFWTTGLVSRQSINHGSWATCPPRHGARSFEIKSSRGLNFAFLSQIKKPPIRIPPTAEAAIPPPKWPAENPGNGHSPTTQPYAERICIPWTIIVLLPVDIVEFESVFRVISCPPRGA